MTSRSRNTHFQIHRCQRADLIALNRAEQPRKAAAAGAVVVMGLALLIPQTLCAQPQSQPEAHPKSQPNETLSANELIRKVVDHELEVNEKDHSHWMYIDQDNIKKQTKAVIETPHGTVYRLLAINRHALDQQQEKAEQERIQQLLANPDAQKKLRENQQNDTGQTEQLFKMLPNAWNYKIASRSGDTVWLDFTPNPKFNPPTYQSRALHEMDGKVEVNTAQMRLMSISGRLIQDVKFGWFGIFGHLAKGGTFEVHQSEVAPNFWKITLLKVNMNGKALFFKTISVHQDEVRSHFQRVPDDLTLEQGENRLREVHYPL